MKKKRLIVLFLQIAAIIAAALFFFNYTQKEIQPTTVYVYAGDMDVNQEIKSSNVKEIEIPGKAVQKGFALKKKDIVGKYVNVDTKTGQFIYSNQLITEGEQDPFDSMDMSRLRKVSFPVSYAQAFGRNLKRGDKVDLVFSTQGSKEEKDEMGGKDQKDFNYSKVFLQDLYVYSVTTEDGRPYADYSESVQTEEEDDAAAQEGEIGVMTIAVTLDQAEEIFARQKAGEVSLIGRFSDNESYETLGYVFGDYDKIFTAPVEIETNRPK